MTNMRGALVGADPNRPELRKFTIFDAMIIIAATAVGLAVIRYSHLRYFAWEEPAVSDRRVYHTLYTIGHLVYGVLPILYALCAAVVVSVLRRGRSWRDTLACSPGSAACFAALMMALAALVFRLLDYAARNPGVLWSDNPFDVFHATAYRAFCSPGAIDSLFSEAGAAAMPAVLAIWLIQLFCGLWNPVQEWTDRLGRVLGFILLSWMLTPH
jgi:hypothetical protein